MKILNKVFSAKILHKIFLNAICKLNCAIILYIHFLALKTVHIMFSFKIFQKCVSQVAKTSFNIVQ